MDSPLTTPLPLPSNCVPLSHSESSTTQSNPHPLTGPVTETMTQSQSTSPSQSGTGPQCPSLSTPSTTPINTSCSLRPSSPVACLSKSDLSWFLFLLTSLAILLFTSVLVYSSSAGDVALPVTRSSTSFNTKLVDLIKLRLDSSSSTPAPSFTFALKSTPWPSQSSQPASSSSSSILPQTYRNSRQLWTSNSGSKSDLSTPQSNTPAMHANAKSSQADNLDVRSRSIIGSRSDMDPDEPSLSPERLQYATRQSSAPVPIGRDSRRNQYNYHQLQQPQQQQQQGTQPNQDIKQRVLQYLAGKINKNEKPQTSTTGVGPGPSQDLNDEKSSTYNRRHQTENQGPDQNGRMSTHLTGSSHKYRSATSLGQSAPSSPVESIPRPTRPLSPKFGPRGTSAATVSPYSPTTSTTTSLPLNLSSSSEQIAKLFSDLNRQTKSGSELEQSQLNGPSVPDSRCGESVVITTSYEISSPNYPQKYKPNMHCVWDIRAGADQTLRVQIFKLSIEVDVSCRFDYLDIEGVREVDQKTRKERTRTKRICGVNLHGSEYKIGSSRTRITFKSDSSGETSGFYLRVIAESQDCVTQLYVNNSSLISSPKYPKNYDDSKNCWTQVRTRPDHRLLVNFQDLNLEKDSRCAYDYVEVFDSLLPNQNKSFGRFCQFPPNSSLLLASSSNSLIFHFESDNFLALRGYQAQVSALRQDVNLSSYMDCHWRVDWHNMTIASPYYPKPYPAGTICETSISASSKQDRVVILFDWIDLSSELSLSVNIGSPNTVKQTNYRHSNSGPNCSLDRLEIWESIGDSRPSQVYCGHQTQPFKFVSSGSSIKLVFKSANIPLSQTPQDRIRASSPAMLGSNSGFKARFAFVETKSSTSPDLSSNKSKSKDRNGQIEPGNPKEVLSPNEPDPTLSQSQLVPVLIRRPVNASVMLGSSHILHCEVENRQTTKSASSPAIVEARFGNQPRQQPPGTSSTGPTASPSFSQAIPIIWFKGDREIHEGVSPDGTSLLIRQFRSSSAGRYICVYGDNSSDAWLTVREDKPKDNTDPTNSCTSSTVLFRERPRDQYTSEGEFVMLHCSVSTAGSMSGSAETEGSSDGPGLDSDSDNEVVISWEKLPLHLTSRDQWDDPDANRPKAVEYNSRIKQLRRGDLLFDPALIEDSGFYFCVVRLKARDNNNNNYRPPNKNNSTGAEGQTFPLDKIDPGSRPDLDDCVFKSAARVQINQRVDVRQYCGRSLAPHANGETGEKPSLISDAGKIIGGTEAHPGEFPWMVMFWDEKRHVFCGGALLNERWVVTAAHCFTDITDESTVFVKLGKYDQTATEPSELVTKIEHITKHPRFSYKTFDNDIALVKLVQHVTFTDYILPICMPSSSEELNALREFYFSPEPQSQSHSSLPTEINNGGGSGPGGSESDTKFGFVAGWGRLKENGPLPRYLHKIRLPIVEEERCHRTTQFNVTGNMFCAGYGKEIVGDACKGDSGGPFAVQFEDRWTLLGIVSWGEGCGRPEKFGYYTKVTNFDNWIRRLTRNTY